MNISHLSSHYHPDGLQRILEMLRSIQKGIKEIMGPKITELLQDNDNEILKLDTIKM